MQALRRIVLHNVQDVDGCLITKPGYRTGPSAFSQRAVEAEIADKLPSPKFKTGRLSARPIPCVSSLPQLSNSSDPPLRHALRGISS
jgi:hypothetical protein